MLNTLLQGKAKPLRELAVQQGSRWGTGQRDSEAIMLNTLQHGKAKPKSWQCSRVRDRELYGGFIK